jgi:hypothetical protein
VDSVLSRVLSTTDSFNKIIVEYYSKERKDQRTPIDSLKLLKDPSHQLLQLENIFRLVDNIPYFTQVWNPAFLYQIESISQGVEGSKELLLVKLIKHYFLGG